MDRRTLLSGLVATALAPGSACAAEPPVDFGFPLPDDAPRLVEWDMGGDHRVAALVPAGHPAARLPMVVALHGAGEIAKPPRDGALGWPRDYALIRAMGRVRHPPLVRADYEDLVRDDALARTNQELASTPYRGLVVVCPRILPGDPAIYARWLVTELVPEARRRLPVLPTREATGIDGVSLGARLAVQIGLAHPELFSAVGSLQPAWSTGPPIVDALREARAVAPTRLRITTSEGDVYRKAAHEAHQQLLAARLDHDFREVVGDHGYAFNRGPGAFELLLWHDRVLARAG